MKKFQFPLLNNDEENQLIRQIEHLRGKYIKSLLVRLEEEGVSTKQIRKIILDCMNDYTRALYKIFGLTDLDD